MFNPRASKSTPRTKSAASATTSAPAPAPAPGPAPVIVPTPTPAPAPAPLVLPCSPLVPLAYNASSNVTDAGALHRPGTGSFWMSGLDSGEEEWVEFLFESPVLVTALALHAAPGRDGTNVRLQAFQDDAWITLHTVDKARIRPTPSASVYTGAVEDAVATYTRYRIVSAPVSYTTYYYAQLFGSL